jgi:hypothetical protein
MVCKIRQIYIFRLQPLPSGIAQADNEKEKDECERQYQSYEKEELLQFAFNTSFEFLDLIILGLRYRHG